MVVSESENYGCMGSATDPGEFFKDRSPSGALWGGLQFKVLEDIARYTPED